MITLDNAVIQVTEASYGMGGEPRIFAQQFEDINAEPPVLFTQKVIPVADLPAPERAAYDVLKAYLEAQLNE